MTLLEAHEAARLKSLTSERYVAVVMETYTHEISVMYEVKVNTKEYDILDTYVNGMLTFFRPGV